MTSTDRSELTRRPRVALTFGDPAGVGGELAAKLLVAPGVTELADILVVASPEELRRAEEQAGVALDVVAGPGTGSAVLADPQRTADVPRALGVVSAEAGAWALDALRFALQLVADGKADAICFGPLNKTSLHLAGMTENDELRWFARLLRFEGKTSELNILDDLWTARVTSHIALADVASRVSADAVTATVLMLDRVLRDAGFPNPRIAVAALNPHAGEGGSFGRQEIDEIAPGIESARAGGVNVDGPFPSDTVFLRALRGKADGIVTMYHDQGQIAMKLMGFDKGVTVQGGLPFPITTPAHGSAFDIVGANAADLGATLHAFRLAASLATRQIAHG